MLIDSHCHLDDTVFDNDRIALLEAARRRGIAAHVLPATTAANWPRLRQICSQHSGLYATYGLHPMFLEHHKPGDLEALRELLQHNRSAGIGECGLDFSQDTTDKKAQHHWFENQLVLAREFNLPIVIHARGAVEAVISAIRASGHYRGVVHSYNGSAVQAKRLIDLGYLMSFGGAVTYDRARRLRELVTHLPLDALMLETDAPDQPDARHRQQRMQPEWLIDIFEVFCNLRSEAPDTIAQATTDNALSLFSIDAADLK
ncbi:MAG: TatD family hydrolase [Granulosicoccus sp.]|nr:TatD family hydrolase [Granulosicoccus sp.]